MNYYNIADLKFYIPYIIAFKINPQKAPAIRNFRLDFYIFKKLLFSVFFKSGKKNALLTNNTVNFTVDND